MLESEIRAAIEKSLSAEVGTLLKERLAQADKDRDAIKSEQAEHGRTKTKLETAVQSLAAHAELDKREKSLQALLVSLDERERELFRREVKCEVVETKCAGAEHRAASIFQLVERIFAKPAFLRTITENDMVPDNRQGYSGLLHTQRSLTERVDPQV